MKKNKIIFGNDNIKNNYAFRLKDLIFQDFYKRVFGQALADIRKVNDFIADKDTKTCYASIKCIYNKTKIKKIIKETIELYDCDQFYCKYKNDTSYKDDTITIFYTKQ